MLFRSSLVAIDSETSQERIAELSAQNHISVDERLVAAEDASIVREALSRLTSAQRTALVMWEVEGRSTEEIAKELGTSVSNVRHVVTRARASFVRVLGEWVIDSNTGTTALEALSTSYKKAAEIAKKSSKVALSMLIVMVAFLGFNSITGVELSNVSTQVLSQSASSSNSTSDLNQEPSKPTFGDFPSKSSNSSSGLNAKINRSVFAGTDKNGLPTGFTVADASGNLGSVMVSSVLPTQLPDGFSLSSNLITASPDALNVLLAQTINFNASGITYLATPAVTINGAWFTLDLDSADVNSFRLEDGSFLISAVLNIKSTIETAIYLESHSGLSVSSIPSRIQTSIIIDSSKSKIISQAVFVNAKGVRL